MNNETVKGKTELILEIVNNQPDLEDDQVLTVLESAFINQFAGQIISNNREGGEEEERHYQLVTLLSDFVNCMKTRFLAEGQVHEIMAGKVLPDLTLFSERLLGLNMDATLLLSECPETDN